MARRCLAGGAITAPFVGDDQSRKSRLYLDLTAHQRLLTEIEVTFTAEGTGGRVNLEHRTLENWGEGSHQARASIDSQGGWSGLLRLYGAAVGVG